MLPDYKKKSITRLKRLRGQLDGIINMIEEDRYCPEILTQVLAAQGGLKSISSYILESHLNTCAGKKLASKDPKVKEAFIKELVNAFKLSSK